MRPQVADLSRSATAIGVDGDYDFILSAASWDVRCVRMMDHCTNLRTSFLAIVEYANQGTSGRSGSHLALLKSQADAVSDHPPAVLRLDSEDILSSWRTLRVLLQDIFRNIGRPLRLLVDLTSLPRYLSLGLLGYGLTSGFAVELDYYYARALSYETGPLFDSFTSGRWLPWPIVGLGRPTRARSRTHLVVSAGMEGAKTRKLVNALEPDRISVVFSSPGASEEVERRSRLENQSLIDAYLVPPEQVLDLPLSVPEAHAALEELRRPELEAHEAFPEVTSFLLCGSKPHALAMAIASMREGCGDVLYVRPEAHEETSAVEIGASSVTRVAWPWASSIPGRM